MQNLGEHIIETQNTDASIKKLAAQKQIYSITKRLFIVQVIVATVVPIVIAFLQSFIPAENKNIGLIFTVYLGGALVIDLILERIITNRKKLAASIQELFDETVLDIPWNYVLVGSKPDPETYFKYYSEHIKKNSVGILKDWYSKEIATVKTNVATLVCQRTNCVYDFSLRKKFNYGFEIVAIATFVILLVIFSISGITLRNFLITVVIPSLPIFILAVKQYLNNDESIKNLRELKSLIETTLVEISIDSIVDVQRIRQIQDKIYCNRSSTPMLPDWVFKKLRSKLESEMNFAVADVIKGIKSNS